MAKKTSVHFDNTKKYIAVGQNIAHYRKRAGLTQEQLAELVDISIQHMGAIEAPNICRPLSLDLLFDIAKVLKIDPADLLIFHD